MRVEALFGFDRLPPNEKLEVRIARLEKSVVRILWLLVSLSGALAGGVVTWIIREYIGSQSLWLLVRFLTTWLVASGIAQPSAFTDAPPYIDLIDP